MHHPRKNDRGQAVVIQHPHAPSPLAHWTSGQACACVVPDGPMIDALNGVPFARWSAAPKSPAGWESLADAHRVDEPPFHVPTALKPAAGVVVREPDGRVWLVCPTNQFGGYVATFPKGRLDKKSPQATALCGAWEESGLQVRLVRWLVDAPRTTTFTRYFLTERVGGRPSDMGWETQAVMLVPAADLAKVASHASDAAVVAALAAAPAL